MQDPQNISLIVAFMAGVLSFFSPCILPLIPSYISYLTGISFSELSGRKSEFPGGPPGPQPEKTKTEVKKLTIFHSLCFIMGFTIIFVALGTGASFFGKILFQHQPVIKKAGGALIIIFGFFMTGVIKVPFLHSMGKFSYKKTKISFLGSGLMGAVFAVAWTPCIGPLLASILVYASS